MRLSGFSQDEQTGDGNEDGAEDIQGRLIDPVPISATVGAVARGNLVRQMAGSEMESGARDCQLRRAAGAAAGVAPVADAKLPTPIGRLIPSD